MNRVTVLIGITALAILTGCAKKEAPPAHPPAGDSDETSVVQHAPAAPKPPPVVDRTKAATEMEALIDPAPQCQKYRDELAAKGKTPGVMSEMNDVLVRAYKDGCGKKKPPKQ